MFYSNRLRTHWLLALSALASSSIAACRIDQSDGSEPPPGGGAGNVAGSGAQAGSGAGGSGAGTSGSGGTASAPGTGGSGAGVAGAAGNAGSGGGAGATNDSDGSVAPASACGVFPAVADLAVAGPFGSVAAAEGPNCTIVRPANLGQGGVTHPVILWANGTGGFVSVYQPAFELWASHGFIVVADNASNGQGSGAGMIACLDYMLQQNATAGSLYQGKVCERIGASGHSQGGGAALMAGQDARVAATAPLMPYIAQGFGGFDQASIGNQRGPMLLLSGTADTIAVPATNQEPVFQTTNVPVFWANLVNGDHVTVSFGIPTYREPMLAWFRLQLLGDAAFRGMFYGPSCSLCTDSAWIVQRKDIN